MIDTVQSVDLTQVINAINTLIGVIGFGIGCFLSHAFLSQLLGD